jgi:hypothetical protein
MLTARVSRPHKGLRLCSHAGIDRGGLSQRGVAFVEPCQIVCHFRQHSGVLLIACEVKEGVFYLGLASGIAQPVNHLPYRQRPLSPRPVQAPAMTGRPMRIVVNKRGEMLRMRERLGRAPSAKIARRVVGGLGDAAQAGLGGERVGKAVEDI